MIIFLSSFVERFRLSIVSLGSHTGHSDEQGKSEYEKLWNKDMHRRCYTQEHIFIDIRMISIINGLNTRLRNNT